jgi:hypothetical protein
MEVAAEPWRVPESSHWYSDTAGSVAILFRDGASTAIPACSLLGAGCGYAVFAWGNFIVAACYISPNCGLSVFEEVLVSVGLWLSAYRRCPALVLGDFNAKSALWGSPRTDRKGRLHGEWAAGFDLCVVNRGSEPTCVRHSEGSIVDITLATPEALRRKGLGGCDGGGDRVRSPVYPDDGLPSDRATSPCAQPPGREEPEMVATAAQRGRLNGCRSRSGLAGARQATGMEGDGEVVPGGDVASLRRRHAPGLLAPPGQAPGVLVDGGGRGAQTRLRGLPTPVHPRAPT